MAPSVPVGMTGNDSGGDGDGDAGGGNFGNAGNSGSVGGAGAPGVAGSGGMVSTPDSSPPAAMDPEPGAFTPLACSGPRTVLRASAALDTVDAGPVEAPSCEIPLPEDALASFDPSTVGFELIGVDQAVPIALVANEGGCDAESGGFYYDNPELPMGIVLCPATCDASALGDGVTLVFGCTPMR